ncbi:nucleoside triphosphate pyrophosphohydrolase [Rufibacter glacialis]|uniref:Nucleoside triphosphate pyrophosphohydrolase n=1 Tax=Rufibacter glacialis TaxID=1259555 RepID=A0A5M8QBD4_9BACT|nr:nucleoside triphosphate pyrophosphohydrolase [Rufibacter glacialis]KAA6433307.1 nucleoside triphosphate pyrophosphohydrolase [Rufibacter glacialis]GGK75560.1 nucleoside triphosphate pyrophosphohydrolase [Rufibacter glacialis]
MEHPAAPAYSRQAQLDAFNRLLDILDDLREKCPWDRKQTMETLRHLTIEETYELSEAILTQDMPEIKKELGDVLLHLVFYAKIASEKGAFDLAEVLNAQCDKLVFRHPHIYGDAKAETEEEVKQNWESLKLKEGNKSVLEGVPSSLPSMVKAMRIQEKARGVGFDWDEPSKVWEKVEEELAEFKAEFDKPHLTPEDKAHATAELGDVFFSLINFARFLDLNPEEALAKTNQKFIKRFQYLEKAAAAQGKKLSEMTLAEMDVYWEQAKTQP